MYALVDCNNFFVSCERVFQPQLEGCPVVVLSNNDGCTVARSNEAKKMGIKMGTPFFQLKKWVDSGVLQVRSSNYALYGDLSSRVMSILSDTVPEIEIYSIDEAFLHLEGIDPARHIPMCRELRAKIRKWVGIPVSIGIAPTKTLAKIASHFAKTYPGYRGVCTILTAEQREKALALTPVGDVWGVGRRFRARLEGQGVQTALDFVHRPQSWVQQNYHIPGVHTWLELQGTEAVAHEDNSRRQSICTSRSFAQMIDDYKELSLRVSDFAAANARKLRSEGSVASCVVTFLRTNRFREDLPQYCPSRAVFLPHPSCDTQQITSAALRALGTIYRPDFLFKSAGVIVCDIEAADAVTESLFDDGLREQRRKNEIISGIMDKVNAASGTSSLRLAVQREGHYSEGIRREHCSPLFSTSLAEALEVK